MKNKFGLLIACVFMLFYTINVIAQKTTPLTEIKNESDNTFGSSIKDSKAYGVHVIFFDDFHSDLGWNGYGSGGWERGPATASASCSGGNDPALDNTSTSDNYIIGTYIGTCYPNSIQTTSWLTSPVINCSHLANCTLEFYRFAGCESSSYDHMYIDVFNGVSWVNIYSNSASFSDFVWTKMIYNVSAYADNNPYFQVRFGLGTTDGSVTYQGWNIDDLSISGTGNFGCVFNDLNQNGIRDSLELGLQNVVINVNPGNLVSQSIVSGTWWLDSIPVGNYIASINVPANWAPSTPTSQSIDIITPNEINNPVDFGLYSSQPCAMPSVSIHMPFIRPCFTNQTIYVSACNSYFASGILFSSYVDVELDSMLIPQSASLPYISLGNDIYRFDLGDLYPGECVNFSIFCNVSCNAISGQTLCMNAKIFPVDICGLDTIPNPYPGNFTPCTLPWDHSSLQVEGYCQNDSVYFVIYNTGDPINGDMVCWSPVRVYIDGVYTILDSVLIAGSDSIVFAFYANGLTWRLEADQHPLHPGHSNPNATVELCGTQTNWTPGLVTILPQDDADPIVDIYCGPATTSYDPNDKAAVPAGVSTNHYIMPNQQLQYLIRFQNTGNDTAFNVVIRDTLDLNLNISSVTPGTASHDYVFRVYGPRVLEWAFNNIYLPDSNINEAASHGFLTFTVNQLPNLPNGTIIYNDADIYFDFNAPVITNLTYHHINDFIQNNIFVYNSSQNNINKNVSVYPNPANNEFYVDINETYGNTMISYKISEVNGRRLYTGSLSPGKNRISEYKLTNGIYILEVETGYEKNVFKIVITN